MPDYISLPIETEPDDLAQEAFDYLTSKVPTWSPSDAQLDTWLISALARQAAELRDVASDVPTSIFRYFGATLMGIQPQTAQPAVINATINVKDSAGYTIPAGYVAGVRDSGGVLFGFQTTQDVVIPSGAIATPAGAVTLTCTTDGADGNGLGAPGWPMELITATNAVTSVVMFISSSSGGQDDEDDDAYLSRLRGELALQAPRPITPPDFAAFALNVAGVGRAVAVDGYDPSLSGTANLTGTLNGTQNVSGLGVGYSGVAVGALVLGVGIPDDTYVQSTNPGGGTMVLTKAATGSGAGFALTFLNGFSQLRAVYVVLQDPSGNAVPNATSIEVQALLQAQREVNFIVNVGDPTVNIVDVNWTATAFPGWDKTAIQAAGNAAIANALNPFNFGSAPGDGPSWYNTHTLRYLDVASTLNGVQGIKDITAVSMRVGGSGAFTSGDIPLIGIVPVPSVGAIVGTVN